MRSGVATPRTRRTPLSDRINGVGGILAIDVLAIREPPEPLDRDELRSLFEALGKEVRVLGHLGAHF